nr:hypothetical protein [Candidatus Sigynarchaeota archaeon]
FCQKWVDIRDNFKCFDFDGDWNPLNNWENAELSSPSPRVYHSVFETKSHYIIMYFLFFPRNQHDLHVFSNYHENDVEGLCVFVQKGINGSHDRLQLVQCQFHNTLGWYSNDSITSSACVDITWSPVLAVDGNSTHPVVIVESGGHGMYISENETREFDGTVYGNASTCQFSFKSSGQANYSLVPVYNTLWTYRHEIEAHGNATDTWRYGGNNEFFITIPGDNYGPLAAKYPWSWSFDEACGLIRGDWFFNPAQFLKKVTGNSTVSCEYVYNPYFFEMGIDFNQEARLLIEGDFYLCIAWVLAALAGIASRVVTRNSNHFDGDGSRARV